jgi:hypothetical protein
MGREPPEKGIEETGSDNGAFLCLYRTTLRRVERQNRREGYREEGLSAPRKDRLCIEEAGCTLVLLRPPHAGARYTPLFQTIPKAADFSVS